MDYLTYKTIGSITDNYKYLLLQYIISDIMGNSMDNKRKLRGYSILASGVKPKIVNNETCLIPSQSNPNVKYTVKNLGYDYTCECPDYQKRKVDCKHINAIKLWLTLKNKINSQDTLELAKELDENPKCAYCGSENLIKRGIRKNQNTIRQRYLCKECNKRFVLDAFKKMKVNGKIVTLVMDLYYKGLSLRDIADTIYQFYNIKLHHETVRIWIMKFTKVMNDFVSKFKPKVSKVWHTDEQMVKIKGKYEWSWNTIDKETRFLLANVITENRFIDDARQVFKEAKETTDVKPEFIITDGLWSYEKAIKKEFHTFKGRKDRTQHIRLETFEKKPNNNLIERFHSTFRERDKVMRGFKAEHTAQGISDGFRTYYNFIRKHHSLNGLTPSQKADIDLQLDRNRWLSLLKKSMENTQVPMVDKNIRSPAD